MIVRNVPLISFIAAPKVLGSKEATTIVTRGGVLKRLHYPLEVMLTCVRWYAAYPLSLRHIEVLAPD
jgi:hypothetical protein